MYAFIKGLDPLQATLPSHYRVYNSRSVFVLLPVFLPFFLPKFFLDFIASFFPLIRENKAQQTGDICKDKNANVVECLQ